MARRRGSFVPRSLVRATDIDVLPLDRVVERREGYLVVRSPSNPGHYWGNLLVFDAPPGAGDGVRWEDLFRAEFAGDPEVRHRTFAWEGTDGALGRAREEFLARGYELEQIVGLVARPEDLRPHPRENRTVRVSALGPEPGADEELWEQVVELQAASRPATVPEDEYRAFARRRLHE
jgi:hypothetical protein